MTPNERKRPACSADRLHGPAFATNNVHSDVSPQVGHDHYVPRDEVVAA